jgi:putative phosphoesterase
MIIGLISDTHENIENIKKSVEIFNDRKTDIVIHCGDIISPIMIKYFKPLNCRMIFVFGNNDGEKIFLKKNIEEIGHSIFPGPYETELDGKKVLIMHEPYGLPGLRKSDYYDYIFFGHTHELSVEKGKPFIINPGETCGYINSKSTIGILDTDSDEYEIIYLSDYSLKGGTY